MGTANPTTTVHHPGEIHWVGNGFPVRSVFSYDDLGQRLSPFLLLDYAAPYRFAPGDEKRGVEEHPHRGFETVTIAYQGEIEHRDSSGGGGIIGPGDVQWMTAGGGLVHEEFHSSKFAREGGMFEMAQLWVNLPAKQKGAKPAYQTLRSVDMPSVTLPDEAGELRVIAGRFGQSQGPARTFTPINLWDATVHAHKTISLPLTSGNSKALFVLRGNIEADGQRAAEGDLVVLRSDLGLVPISALAETKLLILEGEPLNEPIAGYGPFVMNTEAEIKEAFEDFKRGKFGSFSS